MGIRNEFLGLSKNITTTLKSAFQELICKAALQQEINCGVKINCKDLWMN